MLIEMVLGLAEKLVSGEVIPTKFFVRKQTNMIDLKIGDINLDDTIFLKLIEHMFYWKTFLIIRQRYVVVNRF